MALTKFLQDHWNWKMSMSLTQLLQVAALFAVLAESALVAIPDELSLGVTGPETVSVVDGLDGAKLGTGAANAVSYDWWYFDAVSASDNSSVVVVFYNGGPLGFINSIVYYEDGPLSVSISGSFANGTAYSLPVSSTGGAVVDVEGGTITGNWTGSGFSFVGTREEGEEVMSYVISIDSPEIGVYGTITFESLAPAHYPCELGDAVGAEEQIVPHVFWANAVPDASVVTDLVIGDTTMNIKDGVGYHDKNWGDTPFISAVNTWYWGHAHLGPYSIVFFDATDSLGVESFSGYVVKDGEVLESSCSATSVLVRPWGANDAYPPVLFSAPAQGVLVTFELDDGTKFVANITTGLPIISVLLYNRMLGTVEGGVEGGEVYTGRALFEDFQLTPIP